MPRQKRGQKRSVFSLAEIDGEEEIDDMSVAASFAALVYTAPTTSDFNEIAINEEDEELNSDSDEELTLEEGLCSDKEEMVGKEKKQDSESDSDGSDIDLAKERAAIEKMEAKEGNCNVAPKTANELDCYQTPLAELEKRFQLSLTVEEYHKARLSSNANLCLAGNIKSHLVQDRTIIIESSLGIGPNAALDEGSLLVVSMGEVDSNEQAEQIMSLVPLGRVFEVFGPVRRPLYTVRLPSAPKKQKSSQRKKEDGKGSPRREMEPMPEETTNATEEAQIIPVSNAASAGREVENCMTSATEDIKNISMPDAVLCGNEVQSRKKENVDAPSGAPSYLAGLERNRVSTEEVGENEAEIQKSAKSYIISRGMNANDQSQNATNTSQDENPLTTPADNATEGRPMDNNSPKEKSSQSNNAETKDTVVTQSEQLASSLPGKVESRDEAGKSKDQPSLHVTDDKEEQRAGSNSLSETDHWSMDGKYTKFLTSHFELPIYYVQDEAKIIDAETLLHMSTKGCDASNFYDEEVVNVQEMYFSDDEEERQLKAKRKNVKKDASNRNDVASSGGNRPNREHAGRAGREGRGRGHYEAVPFPTGFHWYQPQIQPQPNHNAYQRGIRSPLPHQQQQHQHQPLQRYPTPEVYGHPPVHTHCAPAPHHCAFLRHPLPQNQYYRPCPGQAPTPTPPLPPPQNAPYRHQQQSDTVYYDYS